MKNFKSYGFWTALAGAVVVLINALGKCCGFSVEEEIVTDIIMAVAGVLVVFGIVSMPKKNEGEQTEEQEETEEQTEETEKQIEEKSEKKTDEGQAEEQKARTTKQEKQSTKVQEIVSDEKPKESENHEN